MGMARLGRRCPERTAERFEYPEVHPSSGGIETNQTGTCPECGARMDRGYLVAESYLGGAKWVARKTRLAGGGSRLVPPDTWGNVYLAGGRCPRCRLLVLRY